MWDIHSGEKSKPGWILGEFLRLTTSDHLHRRRQNKIQPYKDNILGRWFCWFKNFFLTIGSLQIDTSTWFYLSEFPVMRRIQYYFHQNSTHLKSFLSFEVIISSHLHTILESQWNSKSEKKKENIAFKNKILNQASPTSLNCSYQMCQFHARAV